MLVALYLPCLALVAFGTTTPALAQSQVEELQRQVDAQRAQIEAQQKQLDEQSARLKAMDEMLARIEQSTSANAKVSAPSPTPTPPVAMASAEAQSPSSAKGQDSDAPLRDSVGDLNASVVAGDFPGSFRIAGGRNVSLAIGGFVKAVAIADSNAEQSGATFLPAFLGTRGRDTDGKYVMDAALSRIFIDGRAPLGNGSVRAYVEWDFNKSNNSSLDPNMRHAYGQWNTGHGTLTAGHTWSTVMNLNILPEGLTEPTVSGVLFSRQAQLRWSQPLSKSATLHVAVENPSNSDVTDYGGRSGFGRSRFPDGVLKLDLKGGSSWQLSAAGLIRDLRVELPNEDLDSKVAWGATVSGYIVPFDGDKFVLSAVYGRGLGRYLLGIQGSAGSAIDPLSDRLELRKTWGITSTYKHAWSANMRSTVMAGYARSEPLDWQDDATFAASAYAAGNLMWQVSPVITVGAEYAYGIRINKAGDDLDNHRLILGIQFY